MECYHVRVTQLRWMLLALALLALPSSARAGIMVVVAHPDDDVILAGGVVHAARLRGERVNVVYVTNGELVGGPLTGIERQGEAVNAQSFLGVGESELIFLGYPDNRLSDLFTNPSYAEPGAVLTSVHGQSVTFGNRGLGHADYHQHRFGMHASFNKKNLLADLADVIATYRPTHILTHADFDVHPDHRQVSAAVRDAVRAAAAKDPTYAATLFHGLVWSIDSRAWPLAANPATYLTEPPGLAPTGFRWVDRHSIDVPRTMLNATPELNPKYLAIDAHVSQGGSGAFIGKSIHRDEVFWAENPTGADRPPRVDAGKPLSVAPGAKVTLDGSQSADLDGPLTYKWVQRDGPPLTLAGADTARPTFTLPADLPTDSVLTFALVVSQGGVTSLEDRVTVQASTRAAAAASTNIAPRAKATASSAKPDHDASKAVDEMVGTAKDTAYEWVSNGERAGAWLRLDWPVPYTIDRVVVHDRPSPTNDAVNVTLTFDGGVTRSAGPLEGAGFTVTFPPITSKSLRVRIDTVSPSTTDAGLAELVVYGVMTASDTTQAVPDGNIAALATVSASSPTAGNVQDATKAVDGVVDGWPNDFSKEWVSSGERGGAWILLEWNEPHVIDRVVLHDRMNPSDNVSNATLTLDGGKPIPTGPLPTDGAPREVKFPPTSARKLRITITATTAGTQNTGLAEVGVYESSEPAAEPSSAIKGKETKKKR